MHPLEKNSVTQPVSRPRRHDTPCGKSSVPAAAARGLNLAVAGGRRKAPVACGPGICDDESMRRACRSSLVAATPLVLLVVTLVCPVMASAAAVASAAGCHERPESHDHDALGSAACCTGVKAATPPQPTHDDGSAVPFGLGSEPDVVPSVRPGCLPSRSQGVAPLPFAQHAVLRI